MTYARDENVRALAQAFGQDIGNLGREVEGAASVTETIVQDIPSLLSSRRVFEVGERILTRTEGQSYEVVAVNGDMATAAGVQLRRIIRDKDVRAPVKYQAYHPAIASVTIEAAANLYRHVPTVISTGGGRLMVAYQFNDTTSVENANPRLIGFHRSDDYGATWTSRATELLDPATCENPQTYDAADTRNGEPFAVFYQGREYLFYQTRFVTGNLNDCMMAVRDPSGGRWHQYRLLFEAGQTDVFTFSDTSIQGDAPAGWDRGVVINGVRFAPNFYKPFEDNLGRLIVPVTFFSSWEVDHRLRFLVLEAGQWRLTDWVPLGDASLGGTWEPTAWQAEDGTYYVLARDHARGRQTTGSTEKHMITASADLQVWRPWEHAGMLMDNSRSMRRKIRPGLWMGVVPTADGRRNSLELFASGDGANWTWGGFPISREQRYVNVSTGQEIGYSDLTNLGNGQVGVVYSRRPPTSTASYTEIHFARFDLPADGHLPVMGSNKYRYDLSTDTSLVGGDPVVSGSELTIQSRMRGVVATRGDYYVLTVAARVTAAPPARPYQIISIGDDDSGYWSIEYRRNATATGTDLYIGGDLIEAGITETDWRTFQIAVDTAERRVYCMGRRYDFGGYPYAILGNTAALTGFNGGPIIYDASRFSLVEYKYGLPSLYRKWRVNRIPALDRRDFETRSEAIASRVPSPVTRIRVGHGGITLAYVADTNGTALTTADGRSWSPDGDAWPEHFGAVTGSVSTAIDDALQRWAAYISSDTRAVTGRLQAGSYRHTRPIVWGNVRNLTLVGEGGNINNGGSRIEYYGTVADAPEGAVVLKSVLHVGLTGVSFINRCPNLPLHFVVGANPGPALSTHFIDISRCGFYDGATGSITSAGVEIAATKFLRFAQNQVSYNGAVGLRLGNDDDSTIIAGAVAVSEIEQNMIFNDLELVHVHSAQLNENSFETRSIGGAGSITIGGQGRVSSVKVNGGAFIDDVSPRTETRPAIATPTYDGTINLSPGSSFVVEGVMFRDRPVGVHIRGGGVSVDACRFMLRNLVPGAVGIRIDDGADNARPIHIGTENDFTLAFRNGMTAIEDNRQNLGGSVIFNSKLATDFTFANVGSMETVITGQPKRPLRGGDYRITVQATILVSSAGGGRYEAEVVVGGVNLGMFCRENGENSEYLTLTGSQIVRLSPTTAASQAVVNFRIRQATGTASMVRGTAQGLTLVQIEELP